MRFGVGASWSLKGFLSGYLSTALWRVIFGGNYAYPNN